MKRDDFTMRLDLGHELIIDNFAGGGGTSTGLQAAFGRPVDIAINHDPEALAMHAINHPHTRHLLESVWEVNPIEVTGNQPVALVWLSPDCKHFSKAKGGTPVAKHIRGLAWVGMRWVALTKPRVLMLENVEEFTTWGPLLVGADGTARPDPARKGKTFESFVRQLRGHGYNVEWRELRACDQGAPTIRKRLFLVARRDGLPIVWPDATHGDPTSAAVLAGKQLPWRSAAECIDFSLPARSVFGRERPLAANTMRRVAKGLWRHVLASPKPFIVGVGGRMGQSPSRSVGAPLQTITSKADSCVAQPVLAPFVANTANGQTTGRGPNAWSADQPLRTVTSSNGFAAVGPVLAPLQGADPIFPTPPATPERPHEYRCNNCGNTFPSYREGDAGIPGACPTCGNEAGIFPLDAAAAPFLTEHANASNQRTMAADEPPRTICAQVKGGHFSVVAPTLAPLRGTEESHLQGDDIEQPLSTISAGGTHHALASANLVTIGYGERAGQEPRALDITRPLGTVVAGGVKHAVVEGAFITKFRANSVGHDIQEPLHTVTANSFIKRPGGSVPLGIVAAHLVDAGHGEGKDGGKRFSHGVRSVERPLNTVTASGATSAVAAVHLTHLTHHGERAGNDPAEPLRTITGAHRGEQALVSACIEQAYGGFYEDNPGRAADDPLSTITSKGSNQRLITAYCVKYYSSGGQWQGLAEPMHTLPTKGRMGLVCPRRSRTEPPRRLNREPGVEADAAMVDCG
ncbi:DNA cytosine methyltransferase [Variovorax sp. CAN2819]|uniref:DNA cytosine methyltransferase n=1 Tax=Variovorax sp. CAN15 TaxID=3046727 RepID=UPI002648B54B|nr:DNA cytosine methyltransferase [Variovorax sp. CAN15]MDN6885459.1 DNA cytosine methyltransferase [Variovorax sp. CAN15]